MSSAERSDDFGTYILRVVTRSVATAYLHQLVLLLGGYSLGTPLVALSARLDEEAADAGADRAGTVDASNFADEPTASVKTDFVEAQKNGHTISEGLATVGAIELCRFPLYASDRPNAWTLHSACGSDGVAKILILVLVTRCYRNLVYEQAGTITSESETGHGMDMIAGVVVGMRAASVSAVAFVDALPTLYRSVRSAFGNGPRTRGVFGLTGATKGVLSSIGSILAKDAVGPIADNADGIGEITAQPGLVRDTMNEPDLAGDTVSATPKGLSVGVASLARFLFLSVLFDQVSEIGRPEAESVAISTLDFFCGGVSAAPTVFYVAIGGAGPA